MENFIVEKLIGTGSSGDVYLSTRTSDSKLFVLKIVSQNYNERVDRMLREVCFSVNILGKIDKSYKRRLFIANSRSDSNM